MKLLNKTIAISLTVFGLIAVMAQLSPASEANQARYAVSTYTTITKQQSLFDLKVAPHHKTGEAKKSDNQLQMPTILQQPSREEANLKDFQDCYRGCRGFGGGVLFCTGACAGAILLNN